MTDLNILASVLNSVLDEVYAEYDITEQYGFEKLQYSVESLEILKNEFHNETDEDLVRGISNALEMSEEEKDKYLDDEDYEDQFEEGENYYKLKNGKYLVVFDEYCWYDFQDDNDECFEDIVWAKVEEKLNS